MSGGIQVYSLPPLLIEILQINYYLMKKLLYE